MPIRTEWLLQDQWVSAPATAVKWREKCLYFEFATEPKFLVMGDVFTAEVIETYLDYKRAHEVDEIRMRPHPYEFVLYYDV